VLALLVASRVVVEIEWVERLAPIFEKQLQTFLRLTAAGPGFRSTGRVEVRPIGVERNERSRSQLQRTAPEAWDQADREQVKKDPRCPPLPRVRRVK
jgi:hypothetical protein